MNDEMTMAIEETAAAPPSSTDIPTLLKDAIAAYRGGRGDDAERLSRQILAQQPDHVAGLQIMGALAGQTGRLPLALRIVQRAVSLQPNLVSAHIQLANLLREDGNFAGAIEELNIALRLQPDNVDAHNDLGLVHLAESQFQRAADCFAEALRLDPESGLTHYNMALALEALGSPAAAIERYQNAVRLRPTLAEAHYKLGLLLDTEGRRERAIECLRAASALRPGTAFALLCEARILGLTDDDTTSEELVRRAIALAPRAGDGHIMLGTILMQQGRFDEAAASFDLANALNTQDVVGPVSLVQVKRLSETDRPLIEQLEHKLQNPGITRQEAVHVHFALGKAYDDLGEYGRAIEHFDRANSLKKSMDKHYDRNAHADLVDRLISRFTPEFFARNKDMAHDWDVPVLIVGMPRSGTTLAEQILSSHPDVTPGGELTFWPDNAPDFGVDRHGRIDPVWMRKAQAAYQARLRQISTTARRVTDKLPQNFQNVGLLHAVFPRARVIHCRRDPMDTCLSIYFTYFANRMDFSFDREWIVDYYQQYARLTEQHWLNVLPSSCLLEIKYEELVAAPEPLIRRMIDFCGLEWDDACLRPEQNQRVVKTASIWQARQPIYGTSVSRWRHYEPWLGVFNRLLPTASGQM
jgi:tetratricopeptide (TPR) repeat protein